eukprot:CAMPEP_0183359792 /NCGR_PEP_ID=MMETSP0164_2-20130417/53284_1 /TAXON_ID=221442 /ORGANISM="Coccolithus pelagicus ssp braarudi, Strain PLY182g" /LENGTH=46 /DNA_ID= /DNA_START= /DNA_END= /DNA_ORIENTATION=
MYHFRVRSLGTGDRPYLILAKEIIPHLRWDRRLQWRACAVAWPACA